MMRWCAVIVAAMFGVYCAGEIGPPDTPETPTAARIAGVGRHLMVTIISR